MSHNETDFTKVASLWPKANLPKPDAIAEPIISPNSSAFMARAQGEARPGFTPGAV